MFSTSVRSTSSDRLVIDESMRVENNVTIRDAKEKENENEPFHEVRRRKEASKRKATNENSQIAQKKSKPLDNFVVYIKGVGINITKKHPKVIQENILKEFGSGIKAQLAGDSLRFICLNEAQKMRVLKTDYLGPDQISSSRPRYETNGGHRGTNKGLISDVNLDISFSELIVDNVQAGLVKAQRIYSYAEGHKYPTKTKSVISK